MLAKLLAVAPFSMLIATPDVDVATIKLTRVDLDWLISDLNHAIFKLDYDDEDAYELRERFESIFETGNCSRRACYCRRPPVADSTYVADAALTGIQQRCESYRYRV